MLASFAAQTRALRFLDRPAPARDLFRGRRVFVPSALRTGFAGDIVRRTFPHPLVSVVRASNAFCGEATASACRVVELRQGVPQAAAHGSGPARLCQDARSADALARRRSGVDGLYVDAAGLSADGRDGRKNWRRQSVAAQVRRCDAPTRAARARAAATLVCREGEQSIGTASALLWQICGGNMTNSGRARAAAALAPLLLAGTLADANAPAGLAAGEATALCKPHLLLGAAADHAERLSTLAAEMAQRVSARQATAKEALIGVNTTQAGGVVKTLADLVGAGDLAKRELLDAVRTANSANREASHAEGELDSFLQTLAALITHGTQREGKSCLAVQKVWTPGPCTRHHNRRAQRHHQGTACSSVRAASAYTQTAYKQAER
ncbi:hypothetical protein ERJ75_000557200 [Trypanosoma vivax]|nr:hypothetical protein ERJ75_000557200 [Trypanosoma vivax]